MCAGVMLLIDSVFWFVIYPFLTGKDYRLNFRFPFFRIAYFVQWTYIFVLFQWIIHACVSMWCTIVHSNMIPLKEQLHTATLKDWQLTEDACNKHSRDGDGIPGCLSKTSHAPQRITLAKPGRVVGPLPPYENRNLIKQAYDPRTLVRNAVIPPQVVHPVYCHRQNGTVKQERSMEMEKDRL